MTIAQHLQPYADRLFERLARDAYAGWLETFGEDRLRLICERVIEEVDEDVMLEASPAHLEDAYEEGFQDGRAAALSAGTSLERLRL